MLPSRHFFQNQFLNPKIFLINFQAIQKQPQKISVSNISKDYQEYICEEKVVAKKGTGGNPGKCIYIYTQKERDR